MTLQQQREIVIISMRKKYDKVDLKSDAFKIKKTPEKKMSQTSRSPVSKSPGFNTSPSTQKIDPNELFQKVCCPNCKYLFKIIKNNELLTQSMQKKKDQKKHMSVQTEQQYATDLKMMSKLSSQLSEKIGPKLSQSVIFKTRLIKQNITKPNELQPQVHIKSQTYEFQERSPFKKSSVYKEKSQSSVKDEREHSKSQAVISKKTPDAKSGEEGRLFKKEQVEVLLKRQLRNELSEELQKVIGKNMKNQKALEYFSEFYSQLPSSVQKPGYAKMLLRQNEAADGLIYFS